MEETTAATVIVKTEDTQQKAMPHKPMLLFVEVKPEPSDNDECLPVSSAAGAEEKLEDNGSRGDDETHRLGSTTNGAQAVVEADKAAIEQPTVVAEEASSAVEEPPVAAEAAAQPAAAKETVATQETVTTVATKETISTPATAQIPSPSVKAEPVAADETDATLPDSFFDDLLQTADEIQAAVCPSSDKADSNTAHALVKSEQLDVVAGDAANSDLPAAAPTTIATGEEALIDAADEEPEESFFDELLVDRVAERLDNVENQELEIKYFDKLKELERLKEKERKKTHKKKKKKSQKRARSSSAERGGHKRRRKSHSQSPNKNDEVPRIRVRQGLDAGSLFPHTPAEPQEQPSTSAGSRVLMPLRVRVKSEFCAQAPSDIINVDELCLPVQQTERFPRRNMNGLILDDSTPLGFHRIKLEKDSNELSVMDAPLESLTPTDKLKRATQRAIIVIEEFKKMRRQQVAPLSSFLYTSTLRKLPSNLSYVTQQIYDNRSPLHTVNNVSYKFSSHATHFNLREWGLEALPSHAAKVAKILGYDAHTLSSKLQTFKLPLKLQRIKREQTAEAVDEMRSSFFTNATTQTDDVPELNGRQPSGYDIGVQTQPSCNSVAVQTSNSGPSATGAFASDDLPLMQQLKQLNEYQLLALSDFAELIREPATTDVFRLRLRMLEIYKCAQMPSAVPLQSPLAGQYGGYEPSPPQQQRLARDPRQHPQPVPQQYARAAAMLPQYQAAVQPPPRQQIPAQYQNHAPYNAAPVYSGGHPAPHQLPPHQPMPAQHMPENNPLRTPHPAVPNAGASKFYGRGAMRR